MPAVMSSHSLSLWLPILFSGLPKPQSQERWFLGGFWKTRRSSSNSLCACVPRLSPRIRLPAVPSLYGQVTRVEVMVWFLGVIHWIVTLKDLLVGLLTGPKISVETPGCSLCSLKRSWDQNVCLPVASLPSLQPQAPGHPSFVCPAVFIFFPLFSMIYVFTNWLM